MLLVIIIITPNALCVCEWEGNFKNLFSLPRSLRPTLALTAESGTYNVNRGESIFLVFCWRQAIIRHKWTTKCPVAVLEKVRGYKIVRIMNMVHPSLPLCSFVLLVSALLFSLSVSPHTDALFTVQCAMFTVIRVHNEREWENMSVGSLRGTSWWAYQNHWYRRVTDHWSFLCTQVNLSLIQG